MSESNLNFICIGAPRSGTTWLSMILRRHPMVFVPPVKELRHFLQQREVVGREQLADELMVKASSPEGRSFLAKWRSYDDTSDDAYLDLFDLPELAGSGRIVGELSPIYCIAKPKEVQRIHRVAGDGCKFLFLMRNPVDRDISHLGLLAKRLPAMDLQLARRKTREREFRLRSDYVRTLNTWREIVGAQNLLTVFYDHIVSQPRAVIERVCRFLDVEYSERIFTDAAISREINSARGHVEQFAFVHQLRHELALRHRENILALCDLFPNDVPADWLDTTEATIAQAL